VTVAFACEAGQLELNGFGPKLSRTHGQRAAETGMRE
jgi:aspartate ammonia-lyase